MYLYFIKNVFEDTIFIFYVISQSSFLTRTNNHLLYFEWLRGDLCENKTWFHLDES